MQKAAFFSRTNAILNTRKRKNAKIRKIGQKSAFPCVKGCRGFLKDPPVGAFFSKKEPAKSISLLLELRNGKKNKNSDRNSNPCKSSSRCWVSIKIAKKGGSNPRFYT